MSLLEAKIMYMWAYLYSQHPAQPFAYNKYCLKFYLQDFRKVAVGWHSAGVDHSQCVLPNSRIHEPWVKADLWGWSEWHIWRKKLLKCELWRIKDVTLNAIWWSWHSYEFCILQRLSSWCLTCGLGILYRVPVEVGNTWKDRQGSDPPGILTANSPGVAASFPGHCISHAVEDNWPCFHLVILPTWLHLIEPGVDIQPHLGQWDSPSPRIQELK